jgi:hypothetical protein
MNNTHRILTRGCLTTYLIVTATIFSFAQTWTGNTIEFNDPTLGSNSDYTAIYRADVIGDRTRLRIRMGDENSSDLQIGYHYYGDGIWQTTFSIDGSGNTYARGYVGIGTNTLTERLNVNGKILAEEVKVIVDVPADYVFNGQYNLMPLSMVSKFIHEKNHLPGIPSASELKENGWQLGEMSNKMLEKIEELTLYLIQQNKEMAELRAELEKMKMELKVK